MKKLALFCTAIGSVFSYSCFAQSNVTDLSSQNDLAVVSYHVEERINMNFGGSIRTYNVTNLDLITPKDIGTNNVRIITPKYGKVKAKGIAVEIESNNEPIVTKQPINADVNIAIAVTPPAVVEEKKHVTIDVIGTYERIMDKGYKSVDMIVKVADRHFFDGNMILAAKWYTELFSNKQDLEAVYYYRFAKSLLDTGQIEKGNEMMKIFEAKSL